MEHRARQHWSVDTESFRARDPEGYAQWVLEEQINFGLRGERISRAALERAWDTLTLDPDRKQYLAFLLWG